MTPLYDHGRRNGGNGACKAGQDAEACARADMLTKADAFLRTALHL